MKTVAAFRNQQKQNKPSFRITPAVEKHFKTKGPSPKRLKFVLSVTAGHVRGGHSFH